VNYKIMSKIRIWSSISIYMINQSRHMMHISYHIFTQLLSYSDHQKPQKLKDTIEWEEFWRLQWGLAIKTFRNQALISLHFQILIDLKIKSKIRLHTVIYHIIPLSKLNCRLTRKKDTNYLCP